MRTRTPPLTARADTGTGALEFKARRGLCPAQVREIATPWHDRRVTPTTMLKEGRHYAGAKGETVGLTVDETAAALEISPSTVKREWASAKAWLLLELESQ